MKLVRIQVVLTFNCYLMSPVFKTRLGGGLCVIVVSQTQHLSSELCDMTCTVWVILIVIYRQPFKWCCRRVQTI